MGDYFFFFFSFFFFEQSLYRLYRPAREGEKDGQTGLMGRIQKTRYTCWPRFVQDRMPRYGGHYSSRKGLSIRIDPLHRFSPSSAEWRNNKAGGDGTVVRERGCEIRENIEWSNVKNHLWNIPRIYFGKLKSRRCIITTGCCKINFHVAVINAIDIHCFGEQWIVRLSRGYDGALCRSFIHSFDQWHTMLRYDKRNYGEIIRTSNAFIRLIGLSWLFHFNFIIEI